jgi:cell division protein FtsL
MNPLAVFTRRIRGFRVIEIIAVMVIIVTALASYAFKTSAGAEDADASNIEAQIRDEQKRIRLLNAELAHLDDPARIEALSTQYLGLAPIAAKQEIALANLPRVAGAPAPPAAPPPAAPIPDAPGQASPDRSVKP